MKEAISSMNNFDLGGQLIRVGPCVVPPSMHQSEIKNYFLWFFTDF